MLDAAPNPDGRSNRAVVAALGQRPRRHRTCHGTCGSSTSARTCRARRRRSTRRRSSTCEATSGPSECRTAARSVRRERWWLHVEPAPECGTPSRDSSRSSPRPRLDEASAVRLAASGDAARQPAHRLRARRRLHLRGAPLTRPRAAGRGRMGTQLREVESGFRYTPTTTFETFPFPRPDGRRSARPSPTRRRRLIELRRGWLEPAWRRASRRQGAHPDQPLQRAPHLARATSTRAWTLPCSTPTAGRTDIADDDLLARLLALNLERASR